MSTSPNIKFFLTGCLAMFLTIAVTAQQKIRGRVCDAVTGEALPFPTIKTGNGLRGTIGDMNGEFELTNPDAQTTIEVLYLGYKAKTILLPGEDRALKIMLTPDEQSLAEVTVRSPDNKIRRLIGNAIANRDRNNPEKYDWYRCRMYYKMVADVGYKIPDSLLTLDTSGEKKELKKFFEDQHLLMSETYSIRSWKRPQKLQEDVLGSRLSGFKKSLFTGMVTDILPFHAYTDYLSLNGKDYHNPVSRGAFQRFSFDIEDEIIQEADTVWILSFRPRKGYEGLSGSVYINSDQYAIAYFLAKAEDESLDRDIKLEQQYKKVAGKWFPAQLNYLIKYHIPEDKKSGYDIVMQGYSKIDSVSFEEEPGFRFDKAHSIRLADRADELSDSEWQHLRPEILSSKERSTYTTMDSLMKEAGMDKIMYYLEKLPEGKIPVSFFDLQLARLYNYNSYEGSRFGLGLQTNERVFRRVSVGGWFGYGTKDREWKYGAFAEVYIDKAKEFVFRAGYDIDLRDPGRMNVHNEIDRNYLRRYLMNRVDLVETYSASVKKRAGYWELELAGRKENIFPRYNYNFYYDNRSHFEFDTKELSFGWRYAFAERRAPLFGRYYNMGTDYPVWYGKINAGRLHSNDLTNDYLQITTALQWQKHINRIGNERFLIMAGKNISKAPLPLSKTFAGNGYRYNQSLSYYAFGGMLTMYPFEYYSDEFVSIIWKHDFDWRLFTISDKKASLSSSPYISIGHNILYGKMSDPSVHKGVNLKVPDTGYHESGAMLNSLVRLKYFNVYHITVNLGYYYHWAPEFDLKSNGRYLMGLGVDL